MKAFIFDMDGTLADSMPYHQAAWSEMVKRLSLPVAIDDAFFHWTAGRTNAEILPKLFGPSASAKQLDDAANLKELLYRELSASAMGPILGAPEFLSLARDHGLAMAVGTAAPPDNIVHILDRLELRQYFQAVVGAADISRGKPDPEVFLKGAQLLGVAPKDCVVFEDAPLGIEAAYRAGMHCVVVTTSIQPSQAHELENSGHILAWVKDFHAPELSRLFFPHIAT